MADIRLEDMIPEEAQVVLYPNGVEKLYTLKKVTLEDEAWMARVFGQEKLQKIFADVDMQNIAKIIFRQLTDKSDFLPREEKTYSDEGDEIVVRVTGPELLMRSIVGKKHQLEVLQAMLKIIGASQPVLDESEKKLVESAKKKTARPK